MTFFIKHIVTFSPIAVGVLLTVIFFWPYFLQGLVPIPADIIVGLYFPWLDYHWGGLVSQTPVKNPLLSDVVSVLFPFKMMAIEQIKSGQLPFWNPAIFNGAPLLANFQSAVFHPTTLLYFLLPPVDAWSLSVISQPLLALIFCFLLLTTFKVSRLAALVASIGYAWGGFAVIWMQYNAHGHTQAVIPLILLAVYRFMRSSKIRWAVLLSWSVGLQIISGYPQLVIYTLLLVGAIVLYHKITTVISWTTVFVMGVFVVCGILLASMQTFPSGQLYSLSQRSGEGIPGGQHLAYLPPQHLLTLLFPDFFGNPATANFWGVGDYTNTVVYSGAVCLVLALVAIVVKKTSPTVQFWTAASLVFLLLALPNPFSQFARQLPFVGQGAAATRIMALFNLSIAILAAVGLDSIKNSQFQSSHFRKVLILLGAVGAAVILGLGICWWLLDMTLVHPLPIVARNLILPSLLLGGLIAALVFYLYRIISPSLAVVMIGLLITLEMFRFGWKYLPFANPQFLYPSTPILEFLQNQQQPFRVYSGEVIPKNLWAPYQLESTEGYDAIYPLRQGQYLGAVNTGKIAFATGRYGDITSVDSPLFDLANNKFVLALKRDVDNRPSLQGPVSQPYQKPWFVPVYQDGTVQILENTRSFPRAYLVQKFQVVTDSQKIINTLLSADFDLPGSVVLEKKPTLALSNIPQSGNQVEIVKRNAHQLLLNVTAGANSLLFVGDSYYADWRAKVDGRETEIYRANFAFRAIEIPKGDHSVEFYYQSDIFVAGVIVTAMAAVFLLVVSFWGIKGGKW